MHRLLHRKSLLACVSLFAAKAQGPSPMYCLQAQGPSRPYRLPYHARAPRKTRRKKSRPPLGKARKLDEFDTTGNV